MKIVVISHTYLVDLNRRKLRELVRLHPDAEVTIIVPAQWEPGGVQSGLVHTKALEETRFRVLPLKNFSRNHQGKLWFGPELIRFLRTYRPDIVQIEQGAKSLAHAQVASARQLFGLPSKIVMFTWWNLPYQLRFPLAQLEQFNLTSTDGLIAGNQDALDILRSHGYLNDAVVLPQLGVDESLFSPRQSTQIRAKLGIESGDTVIGFAGRLVPEKGVGTLLEAFKILLEKVLSRTKRRLLFIGRGPLESDIINSNIPGVLHIPSVEHHEMPDYLNILDVMVLPSQTVPGWIEQFGHVLIEAMSCGVPVIGSDSGEIPAVIGNAGLVFPEGNAPALAEALAQIVTDSSQQASLAEAGRTRVLSHYTDSILATKQFEFYKQLLDSKHM